MSFHEIKIPLRDAILRTRLSFLDIGGDENKLDLFRLVMERFAPSIRARIGQHILEK